MKVGQIGNRFGYSFITALALVAWTPVHSMAQDGRSHTATQHQQPAAEDKSKTNALINIVKESTERFKNVAVAQAEGYALQFGCVSGSDSGAMGLHYVNGPLVADGEIDATRPDTVIYEPTDGGGVRLIGADYLVFKDAWDAKHASPPELMGQLFHLFDAPNRFGLPPFYVLHVWAWKENPTGAFTNWHANVSCDAFSGQSR